MTTQPKIEYMAYELDDRAFISNFNRKILLDL